MLTAQDIMTSKVITVAEDANVRELAALFLSNNISGAPVVNGQGKVIGVVTESDLIFQNKKVHLPTQNDAEQLTGLQAGGISPLALINKGFQVLIDESARSFEQIHISGGQRGLNIRLPVDALAKLVNARFAVISRPE